MYEAAQIIGEAVRTVHRRDAQTLEKFGIDFNLNIIFGGQIKDERCRLFQVYAPGNFIEAHSENSYFQIGEAKYGKPIIDRVVNPATSLNEAAKCALISMDSTLRSNISVGLPLDLLIYETASLAVTRFVTIDEKNQYFQMIRSTWGQQLKAVFEGIADPVWDAAATADANALSAADTRSQPIRVLPPAGVAVPDAKPAAPQTLAQQPGGNRQH
jgi:putative proteasome-type protease